MNIEEIDKWLDIEYGVSYTELEKIHDWLVDKIQAKDKEIERLKNKVKEISEEMNYQINLKTKNANEIYRLTNIINEFDSWLKEKKEQMEEFELYKRKETGAFWYSTMGNIETFIEKINELKGGSSND